MGIDEIKSNLHRLIDKIESEKLLLSFYDILEKSIDSTEGQLWKGLSEDQKEELLISCEESKNPTNLISDKEVRQKHHKWLNK